MTKNRHIPHATAGKKSHSLRAVALTAALLVCVTAAVQPAQAQTATYAVVEGAAREPATEGGLTVDGEFTITLRDLNASQRNAPNLAFFFAFTSGPEPAAPSFGVTPGYGTPDPVMVTNTTDLATRQVAGNDFKIILDYRPLGRRTIIEFENRPGVGYTNGGDRAPRSNPVPPTSPNPSYIYDFRVIPLHDNNDDEGMEFLLFGFRVFFAGTGNANDLVGRVNGGDGDTAITIVEPPPTAEYTLIDGDTHEPAFEGGIANEGEFTITLARLDSFQSESTRNLKFFFRFAFGSGGQTNGYAPEDASLLGQPIATPGDDFDFILEYKDVTSTPVVITGFSTDSDGNYSNDATIPRAMVNNDVDEVYTFRVVPFHDNDNPGGFNPRGDRLAFGYRVQFTGDTSNEHDLHGRVNGFEHRVPIIIIEPPPATAEYALIDGDANEPATASGIANEGKFTIALSNLDESRRDADSLSFFFRFTTSPGNGTTGYGTIDDSVVNPTLATRDANGNDFKFILEYTDVNDTPVVIANFTDSNGNYSNNNTTRASPRAMVNNDGDEVYTFRVVPLHDNSDDEGVESLLFGYRVQFNGINNSNDLQGSVNGGVPDTPVVIGEPLPIVTYAVVDGIAHEPDTEDGIADEGEFTITLSHLNEFQRGAPNLAFFFRFTGEPRDPNPGLPPGYGDRDASVTNPTLATRNTGGLDFKFILEYTVNNNIVTKEFDPALGIYSNNSAPNRASPRATINGGDEVYTFRVVPLHDNNDDEDVEFLLFGFRVFFSGDSDNQHELTGVVNGGDGDPAITIAPLPAAEYTLIDGDANEPATAGGIADEGEFTITLDHLNSDQEAADSVAFFFRFVATPDPAPGQTNGFGTLDPNLSSTKHATISGGDDDFEFILDYRDVDNDPVEITDFRTDSDGNYNNNASPALRAMDDVYTFRVVPLHDNDNDNGPDGEILVFGYRVQFNGIDNSNDLHGRVNGTLDTLVVIDEPIPTATYAVIDGTAHEPAEPAAEGGIADEGEFTITLSHLNEFQSASTRSLIFFFRLTGSPGSPSISNSAPGSTPGYGVRDPSVDVRNPTLATRSDSGGLDFEFILEYTVNSSTVTKMFDPATGVYANRSNPASPRATINGGDEVYTFRVVPLHDNDDSRGGEFLLFGYRVSFGGDSVHQNELKGAVNGGEGDTAIIIDDPLPVALYDRTDGDAREPAIEGGFADEGRFTITLDHLNSDQEAADSVAFFFRFATAPTSPSPGQTNGFGTLYPNLSSTKHATISGGDDDFEFILDYRDVDNDRIVITDFSADSDGNYNNNASPAPRAMDDVYTFRVVPLHDNDNDNGPAGEILVFGYRVFFTGDTNNSNDLHGRVNGGTPDTPVVIGESIPTAAYEVVDPTAREPDTEGGIANEGKFTITLSRLNEVQTNASTLAFFFRFTGDPSISNSGLGSTPGYGIRDASVTNPTLATRSDSGGLDFEFILEYTVDGATVTKEFDPAFGVYDNDSDRVSTPRATINGGNEVYTFRVVPLYDDDEEGKDMEGREFLLFGFRVSFGGDSDHQNELKGQVNGGTGDPAITIADPNTGIRLRIRTFLEGALQ